MKKSFLIVLSFLIQFSLFSQSTAFDEHIRFKIWAELDAYPGMEIKTDSEKEETEEVVQNSQSDIEYFLFAPVEKKDNGIFEYPISRIKEIVPFMMEGLVYGWEFSYTPYDKTRGVEEYFEITPVRKMTYVDGKIEYSEVSIEDEKFCCWIDFYRTEAQKNVYKYWSSVRNPTVQSRGYGELESGFDGIKAACEDSLKNGIREYFRETIKNKPKEITGTVLLRKAPVIGVDSGRYVINLDFFMECDKIREYSSY